MPLLLLVVSFARLFVIMATVPKNVVNSKDGPKLCHNGFVYDFDDNFSSDPSF